MYKRLEVGGKEYHLRIRAKHVEELNKWLKKSYRDAVIDTFEDPVSNVVPFLWAACQQGSDQKPFSRDASVLIFIAYQSNLSWLVWAPYVPKRALSSRPKRLI